MLLDGSRNHCAPTNDACTCDSDAREFFLDASASIVERCVRCDEAAHIYLIVHILCVFHNFLTWQTGVNSSSVHSTQPIVGSVQVLQERNFLQRKKMYLGTAPGAFLTIQCKHSLDSHWH